MIIKSNAYLIIARYLLNGLKESLRSFLLLTSPKRLKKCCLLKALISIKYTNSLRIHRIDRSYSNKFDVLSSLKRIREEAIRGMKRPYRFVGRTITDTGSKDGMKLGLVLEKTGHEHFDDFDCL